VDAGIIIALPVGDRIKLLGEQINTRTATVMEVKPDQRNRVIILGAAPQDTASICRLIETGPYRTQHYACLEELKKHASDTWLAIILDIDSVPLDNRTIRNLTLAYPAIAFFCTSWERFHPEIKDAICYHLFACLNKPIDADELHYLLKCISDDETSSRDPTGG
jgi:hypothetical protein